MSTADWNSFLETDPLGALPALSPSTFGKLLLSVDNATGAVNLILPAQTGHAGQVLSTDGANISWVTSGSAGSRDWSTITNTPTTIAGYGITDAQPLIGIGTTLSLQGITLGHTSSPGSLGLHAINSNLTTLFGNTVGSNPNITFPSNTGILALFSDIPTNLNQLAGTATWAQMPIRNVISYGAKGDGTTVDTTAFQSALTAGGHIVVPYTGASYIIDDVLVIGSNTWLDVDPRATIFSKSGTNATLLRNAVTTTPTDHDIMVTGGTWDGNYSGNAGVAWGGTGPTEILSAKAGGVKGAGGHLGFYGVTHLTLRDITVANGWGFGIQVSVCYDWTATSIRFSGHKRDGIHVNGPSARFTIRDISGDTADDLIALNAWDWTYSAPSTGTVPTSGDITDGTISVLRPNPCAWAAVKMTTGTNAGVYRVIINDVKGTSTNGAFIWGHYPDGEDPSHTSGDGAIGGIVLRDVSMGTTAAPSVSAIQYGSILEILCAAEDVTVDGVEVSDARQPFTQPWFYLPAGKSVATLSINNFRCTANPPSRSFLFDIYGTIGKFTIDNSDFISDGTLSGNQSYQAVLAENGSTLSFLGITNTRFDQTAGVLWQMPTANPIGVAVSNSAITNFSTAFRCQGEVNLRFAQNQFGNSTGSVVLADHANSNVSVRSASNSASGTVLAKSAGSVRWIGSDLAVPSNLLSQSSGDLWRDSVHSGIYARGGTDEVFEVRPHSYGAAGILLNFANDADNSQIPAEFGASQFSFMNGGICVGTTTPAGPGNLLVTGLATFTGATVSGGSLTLSGNQSAPAWLTSGLRLKGISGTLTDTTSATGTVAAAYTNKLGGNTIAATNAGVIFTDYISTYHSEPVAGTNVTFTNKWGLGADSLYVAGLTKTNTLAIGAGSAITSSGAGGALGTGAFAAAFDPTNPGAIGGGTPAAGTFTTLSNTGAATNSKSGAASTAALALSGVPFAGTGTTSFPLLYINDANATASTTLNTAGTYFGVNGHGTADLMNLMVDGVSKFKVTSGGAITTTGGATANFSSGNVQVAALFFGSSSNSKIASDADGVIMLSSTNGGTLTRLNFRGGTSTSNNGPAIGADAVNGFTLQSAAGTATWNDPSTAASGTVANRYLFGIAAPTLTATNATVTDTVASTFYIGGAPAASTNTTITTPYALNVAGGVSKFGGPVVLNGYTVSTLPSTAATGKVQGAVAFVTDGDASLAWGATVVNTGSGATPYQVWYNGTNWTVSGK